MEMIREQMNEQAMRRMEQEIGCTFCEEGECAEMSADLAPYAERTRPIDGVRFGFFEGNAEEVRRLVARVDADWGQYFPDGAPIFCAWEDGRVTSFCLVEADAECILSRAGLRVGSIGCVGTAPEKRGRGIALRMVDMASLWLKAQGCDKAYISYTHIDHWYAKLGYRPFARFTLMAADKK